MNSNKQFMENLEASPALSVLRGDIEKASDLVLVTSPMDALVHYESVKDNSICYVQVDAHQINKFEGPLLDLIEKENLHHVLVASSPKNEPLTKEIESILKEDKKEFEAVALDASMLIKREAEKLGIKKETVESFKEKKILELGEKGEEKASGLTLIKGEKEGAEKIVLVVSEVDAMLHYEKEQRQFFLGYQEIKSGPPHEN